MNTPRTDRTLAAAKRAAKCSHGDDMARTWFAVAMDMRDLARDIEEELNELKSVVKNLSEREPILIEAMRELRATIERRLM